MNQPAQPGQMVTDELGRKIVSYSSLRSFRACRRKYFWRYIRHLVPLELRPGDPRTLGRSVHAAREALSRGLDVDSVLLELWGDVSESHPLFEERERSRAMLRGYMSRWSAAAQADERGSWELLETRFQGDIENPDDPSEVSWDYAAGGKVDGAIYAPSGSHWGPHPLEPGVYLYELKTASRVDDMYLRKLWLDFQILWYSHYVADGLGVELKGVLYDVIEKTKLGHTEAELEADYDARKAALLEQARAGLLHKSEKGGTIKIRKDERPEDFRERCIRGATDWVETSCVRVERETDESYQERLDAHYANPERFHRVVIPISLEHVQDIRRNVWQLLRQHDDSEDHGVWSKNEDQCFSFHRACDYLPICSSLDSPIEIENNFRVHAPHSEQVESDLPIVA